MKGGTARAVSASVGAMLSLIVLSVLLIFALPVGLLIALRRQDARIVRLEGQVSALIHARPHDVPVREAVPSVPEVREDAAPVRVSPIPEPEPVAHVAPDPALASSVDVEPEPSETLGGMFERLVGGRLLIWTGGIAIALAGLFLIRYSIELGLIGPRTRMVMAALFGLALLGAGEWARGRLPQDVRIGQALTGAGVLVLYAAAYGSHILYGLIPLNVAFALMAVVAVVALILSLRQGTPTAALGLVGGFLVPLLVGRETDVAIPMLGYLMGLNVAVFTVARVSGRHWLAWGARLLTLGWTASLLVTAEGQVLATGVFLLVYAVASGLVLGDDDEPAPWIVPTLVLLQMGVVVPVADFVPLAWALFLALAAAGFVLGDRNRGLKRLPASAMIGALLLPFTQGMGSWRHPVETSAAVALLFAGGAWWRMKRADADATGHVWTWAWIFCVAAAGPALILRLWNGNPVLGVEAALFVRPVWGLIMAALACLPAVLAWRLRARARPDAPFDRSLLLAGATAALLLAVAVFDLMPVLLRPIAWTAVALATLGGARRLDDGGLVRLSLIAAAGAALAAAGQVPELWNALAGTLVGTPVLAARLPTPADAALLFAGPAAIAFAMWRWMPAREAGLARAVGAGAAVLAGLAAYVWYKQLFALGTPADFVARGFAERTLLTQGLFFAGWYLARRPRVAQTRMELAVPLGHALTAVAAARFAWFDLLTLNPAAVAQDVGAVPFANLIAPAFFGSGYWLFRARVAANLIAPVRIATARAAESAYLALFLSALVAGAGLIVRQLFHGAVLTGGTMARGELYGYSLAGLVLSVALLMYGGRRSDTPSRVAGLALLTATVVKVFLVDAAELQGVLRILSFLGLGIALIGMGKLYGTLLGRGLGRGLGGSTAPKAAA